MEAALTGTCAYDGKLAGILHTNAMTVLQIL